MLPNFICIGSQKAGTTWLDKMLRSHPSVWLPPKKEIHFFDCMWFPSHKQWDRKATSRVLGNEIRKELGTAKPDYKKITYLSSLISEQDYTYEWYLKWFKAPELVDGNYLCIGDITPEYCMIPQEGVDYMFSKFPDIKIIYLIRDPVDRAWSQVKMRIKRRGLDMSTIDWNKLLRNEDIISRGNYKAYIPRWSQATEGKNILFIPFGKIKSAPEEVMRDVENFLNIPRASYKELSKIVHRNDLNITKPKELSYLREYLRDQYEFLDTFFSPEFTSSLK